MWKPAVRRTCLVGLLSISAAAAATAQSTTFDIYWVDVEGGAATLVVSPTGESLLVDTGGRRTTTAMPHALWRLLEKLVSRGSTTW